MKTINKFKSTTMSTAISYFQSIVNEFISIRTKPVLKSRGRDIFVSKNFETRCKRLNMTTKELLMHLFRTDISVVIRDWMRTRASHDETMKKPHLNMKNFFAWREVGTVYLYIIELDEAIVDIVPKSIDQDFVIWAKECQRFIECSNYPEITHWFNHKVSNEPNDNNTDIDNQYLLEKLQNCFGDRHSLDNNLIGNMTYDKEKHTLWQTVKLSCSTKK